MVGTIVHQLTKDASVEEIEKAGLGAYYTDHGVGLKYFLKEIYKVTTHFAQLYII